MSKIGYPFTFHQSQTPPTVTDEEVEEVPIDTGLIRCICESTEDDGFTIQCDKCLTWQHAFCMNIKQDNIPDRYLCNDCVKLVASLNSQRSSKNNNNNTTQDMDTIGLIHTKPHSNNTIATKRKEDKNKSSHNSNKSLSVKSNSHNKRSRETAVQEDYRSPIHTKTTTSKKPKLSKRITMSKRSLQQQQQQQNNMDSDDEEIMNNNNNDHTQNNNNNNNNNNNDNHHNDDTILHIYQKPIKHHHHHHNKKKEKHHHIDFNTISSKFVHEIMKDTIKRWSQSSKWKSQPWRDADQQDIAISSTSRKHHHQQHHHHPSNEPFIVMDTTSLQQSALNHISIHTLPKQQQSSSTYGQRSTSASSSFSSSSSSRLRKGVFADTQLNANAFLMEVHGEILLKTEYKFDVANDYAILGTACAHVLFYPTLDLCIDSRQLGNDARYFRRSCHPNAELRTMVFPSSSSNDATITATSTLMDHGDHHKSIRLGVFTRTTINEGEEITLGWNWQKGHISWRKNVEWYRSSSQLDTTTTQNRTFSHDTKEDLLHYKYDQHKIDEKLEIKSQYAMEQMMEKFDDEFGNCACGDRDVCLIEQLRQECFNHHHDKNSDMNLQVNGRLSDNLEFTSSLQQHQETGKTLQHSRQIIVTPSNNNNNNNSNLYKMGYEKTVTTVSSPAPGSVEDNIDIDVTSMSPITGSPVLTNPILAQVKKAATLDGDDELDIDSDIDIGEEIPNTNDTPMNKEKEKNEDGKKLSTGQASSPISSSSSGLSDLESANSGGVDDDHNGSGKKRKLMVRSELKEDNHGNIVLWKKSMVTSKKPSVLPFKKAWSKNFSQRDLKLDSNTTKTSTLIVSDIKIQEKPYINSSTTKLDTSSSSSSGSIPNQHSNNNNNSNNNVLMKDDPSPNNKTETDLDDGELSDASSASTIPLEEDDRNWSLRSSSHKLTTSGHNDYSETIASVHKNNNNSNNLESPSPSPSIITSVDTVNELQQHNNNDNNSNSNNNNNDIKNAVVDKDSKNYISDTKSISPNNINDPSKKQPESVPSSSSPSSSPPPPSAITTTNISTVKNESSFSSPSSSSSPSATHLEINDNKDVDQSKPTKVKVSLQEYLSRRLANQDPPSQ